MAKINHILPFSPVALVNVLKRSNDRLLGRRMRVDLTPVDLSRGAGWLSDMIEL
jgi:hypothetical protein